MTMASIINITANFISRVFGPITTMSFLLWFIVNDRHAISWSGDRELLLVTLLTSVIAPIAIFASFYLFGLISDVEVTDRRQRPLALFFVLLIHMVGLYYIWQSDVFWRYVIFFVWWFLVMLTVFIISFIWKISLHMVGISSVCIALIYFYGPAFIPSLLLLPIIAWSRIVLKKHGFWQLFWGSVMPLVWWVLLI